MPTPEEMKIEIAELKARLAPYEPWVRLADARAAMEAITAEHIVLTQRMAVAKREFDVASENRTGPQIEEAKLHAQIAKLQAQIAELQKQVSEMQAQLYAQQIEEVKLHAQIAELQAQL